MSTIDRHNAFRPTVMALALGAALATMAGAARAADEEAPAMTASASAGVAGVGGTGAARAIFGQYNGLRTKTITGTYDFNYERRNEDTGRSVLFTGSKLPDETMEFGFNWKQPGDWKFSAQYGEILRFDPRTANTATTGGSQPKIGLLPGGPGTGSDMIFSTRREGVGLSFSKLFSPRWGIEASLKNERKTGSQFSGMGFNCPSALAPGCVGSSGAATGWATLMLPLPVDQLHTQIETRVNYAGDKMRWSAGYYGSLFSNNAQSITPDVPASLYNAVGNPLPVTAGLRGILSSPFALAPDNQAHNFDVSGTYLYSSSTRMNFKLGYGEASQTQNFAGSGFNNALTGVSNLGAKMITTTAQAGFSSRATSKLTFSGDVRHIDREDHTPLAAYNVEGSQSYTNFRTPNLRTNGKLQGSYRITDDWTGSLGVNFENIDRGYFTPSSAVRGVSALRQKTNETGWRADLHRRLTEDFSGSVSYISSRREGSTWMSPNGGTGLSPVTNFSGAVWGSAIFPVSMADRQRDKIRFFGNWQASEELGLQVTLDYGEDHFTSPSGFAMQATRMWLANVDANYTLSEEWSLNGYASAGNQTLNQARPGAALMAFENRNVTLGVGVKGKPSDSLQVGGGLAYIDDRSLFGQTVQSGTTVTNAAQVTAAGLPDVSFRRTELRGYGRYEFNKNDAVRVDAVWMNARFNDWAWGYGGTPYMYSDGTTVNGMQQSSVGYMGIKYVHSYQ